MLDKALETNGCIEWTKFCHKSRSPERIQERIKLLEKKIAVAQKFAFCPTVEKEDLSLIKLELDILNERLKSLELLKNDS